MSDSDRIRRLEDTLAIQRVLVAYGRLLDRRDFPAYAALFARDGVWDGGFGAATGPAQIQGMMEKMIGGQPNDDPQRNYHLMSSFDIGVDGDAAWAWSRWTFIGLDSEGRPKVLHAGRYDDELVREDGAWKFRLRRVSGDLPGQPPPVGPLDPA